MRSAELGKRFWSKVRKGAPSDCWEWAASLDQHGYGQFRVGGTMSKAHRLALEEANGDIPPGFQVDHMCHNRACVNPDHLRAVPPKWNSQNRHGATIDSRSGIRGVSWHKASRKWRAVGFLNGKHVQVGKFLDIKEAELAISKWRSENYEGCLSIDCIEHPLPQEPSA